MTKVEMYNAILAVEGLTAEQTEFLTKERDAVAKRNARKSGSLTKVQKENVGVKENIVEVLADGAKTATEVAKALELSTQKVSALMRQLIAEGKVVKTMEKKVAYFALAE